MTSTIWFNKTFSHIRSAMALIRAGDQRNIFRIICSSTNAHFQGFLVADEIAIEPSDVIGQAYLGYCLEFCRKNRVKLFYPGKEAALIGNNFRLFEDIGTTVISVASQQALERIHNKALFYEKYQSAAVPTPDFAVVNSFESFTAAYKRLKVQHPVLSIKPAISVYGIGFRIIDEHRSALAHMLGGIDYHVSLSDLQREFERAEHFKPLLLMEYLSGHEYSVDCLASNGHLRCAVQRRKGNESRDGQVIENRVDILEACHMLAEEESLNAIFNAQFKVSADGKLKLLEVNPRMSGGIAMSCLAGPNLPYLAVLDAFEGVNDEQITATKVGARVGEVQQAVFYS
jgi:carbamoylphosphate synthase large subunit